MKKMVQNICIAFIIGALCRHIFFRLYGLFLSFISRYGLEEYFIDLFPKPFGSAIFLIEVLFKILIVTFASVVIPVSFFGYLTVESKKRYWIYSVSSFMGTITFDLFYYSFKFKDLELFLDNYSPIWFGISVVFIWLFLFYWLFSFGKYLRSRKQKK